MIKTRSNVISRLISKVVTFVCIFALIFPLHIGYAQTILDLPTPGDMVNVSPGYVPIIIRGLRVHPQNPLKFNFIIDTGDSGISLQSQAFREESEKLVKYFLSALTVPEKEQWVNLSPYEENRIISEGLGKTDMGRDLLSQDYLLKQFTASLMYPEKELGNEFWQRVYKKAFEKYGTTKIPVNTFNKVWIVPDKGTVYEHDGTVFVIERHLKVMLEQDYFALQKNVDNEKFGAGQGTVATDISSDVVRHVLIPEIEKEVNEGKNFAQLRQIYNSMILATWYKKNLRESLLGQVYMDKNRTKGIDIEDETINQQIFDQYVEAFSKGVYDYIRKDYDEKTQQTIRRKYFSGGAIGFAEKDLREIQQGSSPVSVRAFELAVNSQVGRSGDVEFDLFENSDKADLIVNPSSPITQSADYAHTEELLIEHYKEKHLERGGVADVKIPSYRDDAWRRTVYDGDITVTFNNGETITYSNLFNFFKDTYSQAEDDIREWQIINKDKADELVKKLEEMKPAAVRDGEFQKKTNLTYEEDFFQHTFESRFKPLFLAGPSSAMMNEQGQVEITLRDRKGVVIIRSPKDLIYTLYDVSQSSPIKWSEVPADHERIIADYKSANAGINGGVASVNMQVDIGEEGNTYRGAIDVSFNNGATTQYPNLIKFVKATYTISENVEKWQVGEEEALAAIENLKAEIPESGLTSIAYSRYFEDSFELRFSAFAGHDFYFANINQDGEVIVSQSYTKSKFVFSSVEDYINTLYDVKQSSPITWAEVPEDEERIIADYKSANEGINDGVASVVIPVESQQISRDYSISIYKGEIEVTFNNGVKTRYSNLIKFIKATYTIDENAEDWQVSEAEALELMHELRGRIPEEGIADINYTKFFQGSFESRYRGIRGHGFDFAEIDQDGNVIVEERDTQNQFVFTSPEDYINTLYDVKQSSPVLQNTNQTNAALPFGGIDLDSANLDLQIKRDGEGIPLPVYEQPISDMTINGFLPVLINVTPVSIPMLLGVAEETENNSA